MTGLTHCVPRPRRGWNLRALPLPLSLASHLARAPWTSPSFHCGTTFLLSEPFSTTDRLLSCKGSALHIPWSLPLVPCVDLLGVRRHQHNLPPLLQFLYKSLLDGSPAGNGASLLGAPSCDSPICQGTSNRNIEPG